MGAVTVANVVPGIAGHLRSFEVDVTFSTSYATGGDSLDLGKIGLRQVDDLVVLGFLTKLPTSGKVTGVGIQPVLAGTATAPLIKSTVNGAETTNATNLSTLGAVRVELRGH